MLVAAFRYSSGTSVNSECLRPFALNYGRVQRTPETVKAAVKAERLIHLDVAVTDACIRTCKWLGANLRSSTSRLITDQPLLIGARRACVAEATQDISLITATLHFGVSHFGRSNPFNVGESNTRSFARALPKRDITVPTGHCRTFAIS